MKDKTIQSSGEFSLQKDKDKFASLLDSITKKLNEQEMVCVAIDGNSGSGKTSLAHLLAEEFDCNVFHADDFFLPANLRTPERLAEVGGNFHYERWEQEVCLPLRENRTFSYGVFNCQLMKIAHEQNVTPKKLNILEGCYTLHPTLRKYYDIRVFLTVESAVQRERIRLRNGEQMLRRFVEEWIPKENAYYKAFDIENSADFVFHT